LRDQADSGVEVVQQPTNEGLALATSQDYLTKLASGQGGLGNSDLYRKALPDAGSSQYLVYVDMQRAFALSDDSEVPRDTKAIRAIGLSASTVHTAGTVPRGVVVKGGRGTGGLPREPPRPPPARHPPLGKAHLSQRSPARVGALPRPTPGQSSPAWPPAPRRLPSAALFTHAAAKGALCGLALAQCYSAASPVSPAPAARPIRGS